MSNAVATTPEMASELSADPAVIQRMHRAIQRNAARRVQVQEVDIERSVYVRWRLERANLLHSPEDVGELVTFTPTEAS